MRIVLWMALATCLFLTAPFAMAGPKEDVAAAITKWTEAVSENSTDKVVALYATDAVLWGTSSPTVRADTAAIRAYFEAVFKALPGIKVRLGDQFIRIYGTTAINTGYYNVTYPKDGETKTLPARYSFTYLKDGENWLIVDHHSSASPAPPK